MAKKYASLKQREFDAQKTEVRIEPRAYHGFSFLDIREYYWNGKEMRPTKKASYYSRGRKRGFLKSGCRTA